MIIFSFVALLSCQYATDFRITANQNNFVTKGDVKFENNQLSLSEKWWEVDETINGIATDAQPVDNAEADIVNCAGYLASAKILKKTETVWQAILISETVAKDAEEKIRLCDESLESSYITGTAFAVTPRKEGRKNIKLEKPDL